MNDGPPRRYDDLSAVEARELFGRVVEDAPDRLAAFVAEVRRRDGPAEQLDRSLESLDTIWRWFVVQLRGHRPVDDATMRSAGPPWWYDFHPPWGRELGPELSALATGLADYFFVCLAERVPAARWKIGTRSENRRQAVLEVPGRGEMKRTIPLALVARAVEPGAPVDLSALRRLADVWLGLDPQHEALIAALAEPLPPFVVEAIRRGRFTHEISFDDRVARRRSSRIVAVMQRLAAEPLVEEVVREDRELVLLRAPTMSVERLAEVVAEALEGSSHEASAGDVR